MPSKDRAREDGGGGSAHSSATSIGINSLRKPGAVRFKTGFRNTIYDAMQRRGWRETDGDDWDFHWADRDWIHEVFDTMHLESWQRVNHFRNDKELCRKDLLVKNLKKYKRHLQKSDPEEAAKFDFWPTTYVLPGDYALFAEEFKRHPNTAWIMKPVGRSQGKGIFIFQKLSQISKWKSDSRYSQKNEGADVETYVVQQYVMNPYLVAGRKFDMRIYALVSSYSPLVVYLYRGGFCRFSSARYSSAPGDLENAFMHLTNVAIQKKSDTYDSNHGGKWDIRRLKLFLISRYGIEPTNRLFQDIQMIVIRSLLSVQQVMIQDKHCFELYGYDILFDDMLKPWLVEVNASPSLSANTTEDHELKVTMLSSLLDIVDLEGKLSGNETRVGGFDLIYKNDPIARPHSGVYSTMLGADIPEDQLDSPAPRGRRPRQPQAESGGTAPRRRHGSQATSSAGPSKQHGIVQTSNDGTIDMSAGRIRKTSRVSGSSSTLGSSSAR